MMQRLKNFRHNRSGVAMIEFAFVFPVMFLLLFGGIEVSRYILINQKLEKAAYALTNIVTQYPPALNDKNILGANELNLNNLENNVFTQFDRMMAPYTGNNPRAVIMTSVSLRGDGDSVINWQRISNNGVLATDFDSITGVEANTAVGGPRIAAAFPPEIVTNLKDAQPCENVIVGEVFFEYQPLVAQALDGITGFNALPKQTLHRFFFIHPRNGDLVDLPPIRPFSNPQVGQCLPADGGGGGGGGLAPCNVGTSAQWTSPANDGSCVNGAGPCKYTLKTADGIIDDGREISVSIPNETGSNDTATLQCSNGKLVAVRGCLCYR